MPMTKNSVAIACLISTFALAGGAEAQVTSASDYNHPYGMTQGDENAPVNASLRDANGNLTLVNGQFTSSSMSQQTGLQPMGALGMPSLAASNTVVSGASVTTTGAGAGGASMLGQASAIGNQLNVVTVGNNNTVVVNSKQINNGNQTATVNMTGQ
ncbi:MAG TPA: holdfast anchoring protein HfaA [Rhizomicrobium sp.]|nr:holdfast anchoring protein HfaA [Rhizomicrobium sp.]